MARAKKKHGPVGSPGAEQAFREARQVESERRFVLKQIKRKEKHKGR